MNTRLNRLADTVLRPDSAATAAERAELGQRYVLLLTEFERVEHEGELSVVERDLARLEAEHGLVRPRTRDEQRPSTKRQRGRRTPGHP